MMCPQHCNMLTLVFDNISKTSLRGRLYWFLGTRPLLMTYYSNKRKEGAWASLCGVGIRYENQPKSPRDLWIGLLYAACSVLYAPKLPSVSSSS